jgi:hypothetical protein
LSELKNLRYLSCSYNYFTSINDLIGLGDTQIDPDDFVFGEQKDPTPIGKSNRLSVQSGVSFAGITNGRINLNLKAGDYALELYNMQGRLVGRTNIKAVQGFNSTNLSTSGLAKGIFFLNVKQNGQSVLRNKIMVK